MIELPRAALRAAELAEYADFFSFGTNDLTQTTLGFSRDDAEIGVPRDLPRGRRARAEPVRDASTSTASASSCALGVERGRAAQARASSSASAASTAAIPPRSRSSTGSGSTTCRCSPFRVPIARLAAARAALGDHAVSEPAIDAALTPGETLEPCDVAIVVDTIRATTTALYALRQGYAEVICCGSVEDARAAAAEIGPAAILAGRARVRAHRGLPPRQLAARVRRRAAARRRARADDDQRHARRAAGAGRGVRRARRRAREPLGDRRARRPADAHRAASGWRCAARACAARSRSTTPTPRAASSMR